MTNEFVDSLMLQPNLLWPFPRTQDVLLNIYNVAEFADELVCACEGGQIFMLLLLHILHENDKKKTLSNAKSKSHLIAGQDVYFCPDFHQTNSALSSTNRRPADERTVDTVPSRCPALWSCTDRSNDRIDTRTSIRSFLASTSRTSSGSSHVVPFLC